MTVNPRRPAFRLPWTDGAGDEVTDGPADAAQPAAPGMEGVPEAEATLSADPGESTPMSGLGEPDAGEAQLTPDEPPESGEFLHSLVAAMRGVAEESRDVSLADLRRTVDERIEQLRAADADGAEELRRGCQLDVEATAEWEQAEVERIKAEAERKVAARQAELERQLAEHRTASDRQIEATRRRVADYERDLTAFFAQLSAIEDPAAFVAAAKRMPRPPELATVTPTPPAPTLSAPPPAAPATEPAIGPAPSFADLAAQRAALVPPAGGEPAAEASTEPAVGPGEAAEGESSDAQLAGRLAELDQRLSNGTTASAPPPSPAGSEEANGEMSTAITVKGLGSFGAITSFKQALERAEGISGVTLSLGTSGEFVYRASHAPGFDLVAAIRAIEGQAASIDETNGSLLVTIHRGR